MASSSAPLPRESEPLDVGGGLGLRPLNAPALARALLWAAGVAAGLIAFLAIALDERDPHATTDAALTLLVGWSFLACGLVAWPRQQAQRLGALMACLGLVWLVAAALGEVEARPAYVIGFVGANLSLALFLHVLLALPSGRLASRLELAVAVAGYVVLAGMAAARLAVDGVPDGRLAGRALLLRRESPLTTSTGAVSGALSVLLAVAVLLLLWRHWRWATRPLRRVLAPALAAGALAVALLLAAALVGPSSGDAGRALAWAAFLAMGAVPPASLASILQSRLARAGVGDLLVQLERARTPGALRDALARALGDPTLRLAYWVSDAHGFVDLRGRPFELPWEGSAQVATLVERDGRRVAALVHDASVAENRELLDAVGAAAGLALENERLQAELRAHLDELHASRARIVEAGDAERRRLERNLHDGAQQRLVSIALVLRLAENSLQRGDGSGVELLTRAREELAEALEELRELARGIHPAILTQRGLRPALEALAVRSGIPVEVDAPPERLPAPVEAAVYYVACEALANVAKYADATSVDVRIACAGGLASVEVADDGVGGADASRGSGLQGLADRVAALDGRLSVDSPPGKGTRVVAEIPCAPEDVAPRPAGA